MNAGIREPWKANEKPNVNQWYRIKSETDVDFYKITKDFRSEELQTTFYKIVEYVNSDIIFCGKTLAQAREILKDFTWRKAV